MKCRICEDEPKKILSLGKMPLANGFLTRRQFKKERKFELDLYECRNCGLIQLNKIPPKELMFTNYPYLTGTSEQMARHLHGLAIDALYKINKPNTFVIDIGSNDGTLLKHFKENGAKVLGIEPAKNLAKKARKDGIPTISKFFDSDIVPKIIKKYGKADVIVATNTLCHIDNLMHFVFCVSLLLKEDGIFVHEDPFYHRIAENNEFDQIYHEHVSYFKIKPLSILFEKNAMEIIKVQEVPVHGGSIRVYSKFKKGFDNEKLEEMRWDLIKLLGELKEKNKKVIGYGASSKGNVLLNYFKIGTDLISYIVDNTPEKQNKFTPGMHIPIKTPDKLYDADYAVIFAWNWKDEIMNKHKDWKGRWITPIPEVKIL